MVLVKILPKSFIEIVVGSRSDGGAKGSVLTVVLVKILPKSFTAVRRQLCVLGDLLFKEATGGEARPWDAREKNPSAT